MLLFCPLLDHFYYYHYYYFYYYCYYYFHYYIISIIVVVAVIITSIVVFIFLFAIVMTTTTAKIYSQYLLLSMWPQVPLNFYQSFSFLPNAHSPVLDIFLCTCQQFILQHLQRGVFMRAIPPEIHPHKSVNRKMT